MFPDRRQKKNWPGANSVSTSSRAGTTHQEKQDARRTLIIKPAMTGSLSFVFDGLDSWTRPVFSHTPKFLDLVFFHSTDNSLKKKKLLQCWFRYSQQCRIRSNKCHIRFNAIFNHRAPSGESFSHYTTPFLAGVLPECISQRNCSFLSLWQNVLQLSLAAVWKANPGNTITSGSAHTAGTTVCNVDSLCLHCSPRGMPRRLKPHIWNVVRICRAAEITNGQGQKKLHCETTYLKCLQMISRSVSNHHFQGNSFTPELL